MRNIIFILFLLSISCGSIVERDYKKITTVEPKIPKKNWNEELIPYIDEFMDYVHIYNLKTFPLEKLKIVDYGIPDKDNKNIIGMCYQYNYENKPLYNKIIIIKEKRDIYLKQLMFHELGHCLLNLKHVDDPGSIMYAYRNDKIFENFYNKIEKMFKRAKRGQDGQ